MVLAGAACSTSTVDTSVVGTQPSEPITLRLSTFFEDPGVSGAIEAVIAAYEKEFPHVTIEIENAGWGDYWDRALTQAASGEMADVVHGMPGFDGVIRANDLYLDVSDFAAQDAGLDIDDFSEGMMGYLTDGPRILGFPYDLNGSVLFYNVDVFDRLGMAHPDDDWSFDDARAAALEIQAAEPDLHAFACVPRGSWVGDGFFRSWGGDYTDDPGVVAANSPEGVEMMEWYVENIDSGITRAPFHPYDWAADFAAGTVAMGCANGTRFSTILAGEANWDFVQQPDGPVAAIANVHGGTVHVSATTEHPEEAYELLAALTSGPALKAIIADNAQGLPARASSRDDMEPHQVEYGEKLEDYEPARLPTGIAPVWGLAESLFQEVWIGDLTPQDALQQLETEGNQILADAAS
jgi:multiple sugar transport system substrate-binding protein